MKNISNTVAAAFADVVALPLNPPPAAGKLNAPPENIADEDDEDEEEMPAIAKAAAVAAAATAVELEEFDREDDDFFAPPIPLLLLLLLLLTNGSDDDDGDGVHGGCRSCRCHGCRSCCSVLLLSLLLLLLLLLLQLLQHGSPRTAGRVVECPLPLLPPGPKWPLSASSLICCGFSRDLLTVPFGLLDVANIDRAGLRFGRELLPLLLARAEEDALPPFDL
uniref:Uncharacterized protein n=1 Tax=Anopheles atroparvus TaxID=41427 RepID=A0A182JDZ0_ANOAO